MDEPERGHSYPNRDNEPAAALRFTLEVLSWIAIQRLWGWLALAIAVLLLALFNAPGDKRISAIRVPGPLRFLLEIALFLAGAWAAGQWLGGLAALAMLGALLLLLLLGRDRYRWLLAG